MKCRKCGRVLDVWTWRTGKDADGQMVERWWPRREIGPVTSKTGPVTNSELPGAVVGLLEREEMFMYCCHHSCGVRLLPWREVFAGLASATDGPGYFEV